MKTNFLPKVLSFGRGRGKFPLANWTSVTKVHGCRFISRCDMPQAPPVHQESTIERNLAIVAPTDRVQTYEGNLAPSKSQKGFSQLEILQLDLPIIIGWNKASGRDLMTILTTGH